MTNYRISSDGNTKVAVDIQDLTSELVIDQLLDEKAEVFQTQRGRKAILIGTAALQRLTKKLSLNLEDGNDGCAALRG